MGMKAKKNGNANNFEEYQKEFNMTPEQIKEEESKEYKFEIAKTVAKSLKQAIADGQKITIVGDYDADGITSSAILYLTLTSLGANCDIRIPHRFSEGYGINESIIDEIENGILITVDNGIMAHDAIQKAVDKGLYTILTDHHLPGEILPSANIIMNAHIEGTADFEDYCGAGDALMIAKELIPDTILYEKLKTIATIGTIADVMPLRYDNRKIVKDGLENINKNQMTDGLYILLTKLGLIREDNGKIYFNINTEDIGYLIAPAINAAERMEDGNAVLPLSIITRDNEIENVLNKYKFKNTDIELYKSTIITLMNKTIPEITEMENTLNTERENVKNLNELISVLEIKIAKGETEYTDELSKYQNLLNSNKRKVDNIEKKYFAMKNNCENKISILNKLNTQYKVDNEDFKKIKISISRISAWCDKLIEFNEKRKELTKIFEEKAIKIYEEQIINGTDTSPIIIRMDDAPEGLLGIIAGHFADKYDEPTFVFAESENGILKGSGRNACGINLKELCDKVGDEFVGYGGHEGAVGCSVDINNFDNFKEKISEACIKPLGYTKDDTVGYNFEITMDKLPELMEKIKEYGPFGEGFPMPRILIKDFELNSFTWAPDGVQFIGDNKSTIKFLGKNNISALGFNMADKYTKSSGKIAVIGTLSENYYNGKTSLQLMIEDFCPSDELEIVKNDKNIEEVAL